MVNQESAAVAIVKAAMAARVADLAAPAVDVGVTVIVQSTGRRGDVVRVTDPGGLSQRPIYHVRQRRGGRVTMLYRDEFVIEWR